MMEHKMERLHAGRWLLGALTHRWVLVPTLIATLLAGCATIPEAAQPTNAPATSADIAPSVQPEATTDAPPNTIATAPAATAIIEDAAPENISISDLTGSPEAYVGKIAVIEGTIAEQVGQRSFTVGLEGAQGDAATVLVVGAPEGAMRPAGETIQVTGTVYQFDLAEIEQSAGYDLQDELFADYEGEPVIVARDVQAPTGTGTGEGGQTTSGAGNEATPAGPAVTVPEILANPSAYRDTPTDVRGTVEQVIGQGSFALKEGDAPAVSDNLLLVVAGSDAVQRVNEDLRSDKVIVTGTVQTFDLAAIEQRIGEDLDDALFADWTNRPVLIATAVRNVQ
jgi:hypothetical protein